MDNIIDDTNLLHIESNADDSLLLDLDTEGFDNIELENIDSYRLQFIELPRILKEFNINVAQLDKSRLEVSLMILDCIYVDLDNIEFEFYRIENHDCLLLDFSKINLQAPEAIYILLMQDERGEINYYTFEISDGDRRFCFCKIKKSRHLNMGFFNKISPTEFKDLCLKSVK